MISRVIGRKRVLGVNVCLSSGEGETIERIGCDAVAMSGGWSPVVHLWSHCGGKLEWNDESSMFCPDKSRPPTNENGESFVETVGAASGNTQFNEIVKEATELGLSIGKNLEENKFDLMCLR